MESRVGTAKALINKCLFFFIIILLTSLTACGGGGKSKSKKSSGGGSVTASLSGGGVDGPLAFSIVSLYEIDISVVDFKGSALGTGTTNAQAEIDGITKPDAVGAPYLLEFTANSDTRDLTACSDDDSSGTIDVATECLAPVVGILRTIVTADMLNSDQLVYATLLTTMATDIAIKATFAVGGSTNDLLAELELAAAQVKSTVGFGLGSETDIFTTPPILTEDTDTEEEQEQVAAYRSAVQALASVVNQISDAVGGVDPADVLTAMSNDLSDGEIDGQVDGVQEDLYDGDGDGAGDAAGATAALQLLDQDPETLPIPNDPLGRTVGDMAAILVEEIEETGNENLTTEIDENTEVVLQPAEKDPDLDDDGVPNESDAFPNDGSEDTDTDGDGIGNNSDGDDDNDGVADGNDDFPLNSNETTDTDSDGTGNNEDTDDDGDNVADDVDDFPLDGTRSDATDQDGDGWPAGQDPDDNNSNNPGTSFVDTDGDGVGDTTDNDDDNDGVDDGSDAFPLNSAEQNDQDGDGFGDNSDDDVDGDFRSNHVNGDLVLNTDDTVATSELDRFPRDNSEWTDTDNDGIGNNTDDDDDNDGVTDTDELTIGTNPLLRDTDGDGALDGSDAFPLNPFATFDSDGDSLPARPTVEDENNPIPEDIVFDNCPIIPNPDQTDTDGDNLGNACDKDDDGDGVLDVDDALPLNSEESLDTDEDGVGNNADTDDDNDGTLDIHDDFPLDSTERTDTDEDGIGNNADTDDDGDGVLDEQDAFPLDPNSSDSSDQDNDGWPTEQDADDTDPNVPGDTFVDTDGDGVGDTTDPDDDNDGVPDAEDDLPLDEADSIDTDSDGTGDSTDTDIDGDSVLNEVDAFPYDGTETIDTDGDGIGNNSDPDDDNDGIADANDIDSLNPDADADTIYDGVDNCPTVSNSDQQNADGDNMGDACDTDDDNDSIPDAQPDNCPFIANTDQLNTDGDEKGDLCDGDDDNDGVSDSADAFPLDPEENADSDGDQIGNNADNCPAINNPDQLDTDSDTQGNVCDEDDDGDTLTDIEEAALGTDPLLVDTDTDAVNDNLDNCPIDSNGDQLDTDSDDLGDVCDVDDDGDTLTDEDEAALGTDPLLADTDTDAVNDNLDNCPVDSNGDQLDTDSDDLGDVCDVDDDGDTVADANDNCPLIPNPDQEDSNSNGEGDACEGDPADLAGFWLASIAVATEEESGTMPDGSDVADVCDIDAGNNHAAVAFIKQSGTEIQLQFGDDHEDGDSGVTDGLGNVTFGNEDDWNEYDYSSGVPQFLFSVSEGFSFAGEVDDLTSATAINGVTVTETITVYSGENQSGDVTATCIYTYTGGLDLMSQVAASDLLSDTGTDMGLGFTNSWDFYFDPTGVDIFEFGYTEITDVASNDYGWNGVDWDVIDDAVWLLTSNGWSSFSGVPAVNGTPATTAILARESGGIFGSQWEVSGYAGTVTGLPMLEFADRDWEEGIADPAADFSGANARAVGITATTLMDEYAVRCDMEMPADILLCHNWVWQSFPSTGNSDDASTTDLADDLSDVLQSSGSTPTSPIGGIAIGEYDNGEQVFAWLTGLDTSGAVSTDGDVAFYRFNESSGVSEVSGVISSWAITDPNSNGTLILGFAIPETLQVERLYYGFEENHNVVITLAALEDSVAYLRVGTFTETGTTMQHVGVNGVALAELLSGFSYTKPDTDSDTVVDDDDNCPVDANQDQADADGDGVGDVCDVAGQDSDNDGVNDDVDNCPSVSNSDQSDIDSDQMGDVCDSDMDGDGIENGSDNCPMDPSNTCGGSGTVNDSDGDGVPDSEDAFVNDATEQSDADGDGVGDNSDGCPYIADPNQDAVCDDPTADTSDNMDGFYLASWTATGQEHDENSGTCVTLTDTSGSDVLSFTQIGNQVLLRGEDDEGSWEDRGTIDANGGFTVSSEDDSFSLSGTFIVGGTFDATFTETDNSCEQSGSVTFNPGSAVTESSVGSTGLAWFESDHDWNELTQQEMLFFEYGLISDTGPEMFFEYNQSTESWDEITDIDADYVLTDSGVVDLQDRYTITGYVDTGETAIVHAYVADGSTTSTLLEAHVDLLELNLDTLQMGLFLGPDYEQGLESSDVFGTGASAYFATITEQNDVYEFWCDDDWNDYVTATYTGCANIVAKDYQDLNSDGESDPVAAISLDEVVSTVTDFENGTVSGTAQWVGDGEDADGRFQIQIYLVSDDGNASGANPTAKVVKHYDNASDFWGDKIVMDEVGFVSTTLGSTSLIEWDVPELAAKLADLDKDDMHPFIFEESTLDSQPLVRRGERLMAGTVEVEMLFNAAAKDDIVAAFAFTVMDSDSDGIADDVDNCPSVSNSNQSDIDSDQMGDACDSDMDGDGIENGLDNCPMDPSNTCGGSGTVNDTDGDGVPDSEDAFVSDATEQNDADEDGVGDNADNCPYIANPNQDAVCDDPTADTSDNMDGFYLASWTASGSEYDDSIQDCVALSETSGSDVLSFTQIGNQVLLRGEDDEGSWEDRGTIDANGDFTVASEDGSFSLSGTFIVGGTFDATFTETDVFCEQTGSVTFNPGTTTVESSVGASGFSWFESDHDWNEATQMDSVFFEYGIITDSGPESFFEYNHSTVSWDALTDNEADYILTASGVVELQDRYTIDGYVSGGETAIIHAYESSGTTTSSLLEAHIDVMALDLNGLDMGLFLEPEFHQGIEQGDVFASGATAYIATITEQNDAYEFWCDDDWNEYVTATYTGCANIVAKDYQDLNSDSVFDPVAAESLDEVVSTAAEFDNGTASGTAQWIGDSEDSGGGFQIQIYLVSDDGSASGANPTAKVVKHYDNASDFWGDKIVIDEVGFVSATLGSTNLIEWDVPELAAKLADLDSDEGFPFIFEESTLDSTPLVRRGERIVAGSMETEVVFNGTAKDQIVAAFTPVTGVFQMSSESVVFTFLPNGAYFGIQWDEPNSNIGFERGGFELQGNELHVNTEQNDDGEALFCGNAEGVPCNDNMLDVSVSDTALTVSPGTVEEAVLTREVMTGTGVVGVWQLMDENVLFLFLPGDEYYAIQWQESGGFVGFERGTYSLNSDQLTVTVDQNDDGEALLCNTATVSCAAQVFTVSVSDDTFILDPTGDAVMFERQL